MFDSPIAMLDVALDSTPIMLEDISVVLAPTTAAVVEAITVLLGAEDVWGAAELTHDTTEGRVTPALRSQL